MDDFPELIDQAHEMVTALRREPGQVEALELTGFNHFDTSERTGQPDDVWTRRVLKCLANTETRAKAA
jgi:hypothetical protein